MTDTTTTLAALTRDDITAIRAADTVSFHHGPNYGPKIRLSLGGGYSDQPRIYTAREQRLYPQQDGDRTRELRVASSMSGYAEEGFGMWRGQDFPNATGFHMIHSPRYNDEWQTVVSLLRTDDVLTMVWSADNNTGTARDFGLHIDELRLRIDRNGGAPAEKGSTLTFLLTVSMCRDNSARMIRQHGH